MKQTFFIDTIQYENYAPYFHTCITELSEFIKIGHAVEAGYRCKEFYLIFIVDLLRNLTLTIVCWSLRASSAHAHCAVRTRPELKILYYTSLFSSGVLGYIKLLYDLLFDVIFIG